MWSSSSLLSDLTIIPDLLLTLLLKFELIVSILSKFNNKKVHNKDIIDGSFEDEKQNDDEKDN